MTNICGTLWCVKSHNKADSRKQLGQQESNIEIWDSYVSKPVKMHDRTVLI